MLHSELKDGILRIFFDAPEVANAFSVDDAKILLKILKGKNKIRFLVWESHRQVPFCSGGNLKFYSELKSKSAGVKSNRLITKSLNALENAPFPTVALVQGDVWGGGVELLACFDHVVAAPYCMFGLWQRRIGLIFGWGGGRRLAARLTLPELKRRARQCHPMSAIEALRIGLIDEIVPESRMEDRIQRLIDNELSLPEMAGRTLKRWRTDKEAQYFEALWWGREHRQTLAQFKARGR